MTSVLEQASHPDGFVFRADATSPDGFAADRRSAQGMDARGRFVPARENATGDFVVRDPADRSITLQSANGLPWPLFYGGGRGALVVGRSIAWVRARLRELGTETPPDPLGAGLMFCMDGFVCGHTPFKGVHALRMAERLVFRPPYDSPAASPVWTPRFACPDLAGLTLDRAVDGFCERFEALTLPDGPLLIPLSGGLDSRLLVALAHRRGKPVHTYTFRRRPSFEADCARRIAARLGLPHSDIDLPVECYDSFADRLAVETGCALTGMHVHGYYAAKQLGEDIRSLPRVFGYMGDPIAGGFQSEPNEPSSLNGLVANVLRQNTGNWQLTPPEVQEAFYYLVSREMNFFGIPTERHGEAVLCFTRQQGLITHIFDIHSREADVYRPYLDASLIEYGLGLPAEYRRHRLAFLLACRKMFPDVFSLPGTHVPGGWRGWPRRGRTTFSRGLQFATWAAFGPRHAYRSPFTYEHHKALIAGPLRDKLLRSTATVCDFLGVPELDIRFTRRGIFPGAAFRIMALAAVLENG